MAKDEFLHLYRGLDIKTQAIFLADLAHDFTIVARFFYTQGPKGLDAPSGVLIALNELQHQVSGQLGHLLKGDENRYPDDVFVAILIESAQKEGLEPHFLGSIQRTASRFKER